MSRETDSQERQTVRALLPTVSPDTDKLLKEIKGQIIGTGMAVLMLGCFAASMLVLIVSALRRLIEAQAP